VYIETDNQSNYDLYYALWSIVKCEVFNHYDSRRKNNQNWDNVRRLVSDQNRVCHRMFRIVLIFQLERAHGIRRRGEIMNPIIRHAKTLAGLPITAENVIEKLTTVFSNLGSLVGDGNNQD